MNADVIYVSKISQLSFANLMALKKLTKKSYQKMADDADLEVDKVGFKNERKELNRIIKRVIFDKILELREINELI